MSGQMGYFGQFCLHALVLFWLHSRQYMTFVDSGVRHVLVIYIRKMLGIYWQYSAHMLTTCWSYISYALATYWLRIGHRLLKYWPYIGQIFL